MILDMLKAIKMFGDLVIFSELSGQTSKKS